MIDTKKLVLTAAARLISPELLGMLDALHPFRGMGEPEDIARATLFPSSEDACWITGQCLAVDSGYMIQSMGARI
jgi:NAD(P)-dependent dehydrogenase (short-subunit alcohol dehydrogenase family)